MIQSLEGMDLTDRIREMSGRIAKRLNSIKTEEATKTALVLPFITHVLGFSVFDPDEVVPEYTADVGTKKGEKVDYAIVANGSPIMIFECKHYGVDLTKEPASQLYRYFSVTEARLGVLTDGVTYRFYSDIDAPNKMDRRPFLELNMLDAESIDADEIKRFTKPAFDLEKILDTSKDLKYTREVLRLLAAEWANPSEALVRHFAGQIYEGVKTKAVIDQFERATRKAMHQFLTGRISDRLKSALSSTDDAEPVVSEAVAEPAPTDNDVVTTEEELARLLRRHGDSDAGRTGRPGHTPGRQALLLGAARQYEPATDLPAALQHSSKAARARRREQVGGACARRRRERHLRPRRAHPRDGATVSGEGRPACRCAVTGGLASTPAEQ